MTYCCSVFPKIAKRFIWLHNEKRTRRSYPFLNGWEINFCPHCGKDIRGIVITKEEFDKLK